MTNQAKSVKNVALKLYNVIIKNLGEGMEFNTVESEVWGNGLEKKKSFV